jgi:hypothetical protein
MPEQQTQKKIWSRIAWEFLPPLALAVVWIFFRYVKPERFTADPKWLDAVRDFSVAFFMLSWLWNAYNRIEYQTVTRVRDEKLDENVTKIAQTLNTVKEVIEGLPGKSPETQEQEIEELSELIDEANIRIKDIKTVRIEVEDFFRKERRRPY